jgi:predicted aconitase with swiveling domain
MSKTFQGRAVIPGHIEGEALVTHSAFNILASFRKNLLISVTKKAVCGDHDNPELYQKVLTDKILCLPNTSGSTAGGLLLETAVDRGVMPKAMLFSEHIDSLAASGVILAEIWLGKRIITVDQLGKEFLDYVQNGHMIEIQEDGTIIVE